MNDSELLSKSSTEPVMLLWSGGIESTSLLLWALTNTKWHIVAHHIRLDNTERRMLSEGAAVRELMPLLAGVRPFKFVHSLVSIDGGRATPPDYTLLYPIGWAAAQQNGCQTLLRAWCSEDDWTRTITSDGTTRVELRHARGPAGRYRQHQAAIEHLLPQGDTPERASPWLPPHWWAKAQHWRHLGPLAPHTFSCRRPLGSGTPCRVCFSCVARAAAEQGRSTIREVTNELQGT